MDEIFLRQKSRALWLRVDDGNTRFFIERLIFDGSFNSTSIVIVDGNHFENFEGMKSSIHGFYKTLFTRSEAWRPEGDGLSMPSLSVSARVRLESDFLEEGVLKALHRCCGDDPLVRMT